MGILDRDLELEKFHVEMRIRELELTRKISKETASIHLESDKKKTYTAIDNLRDAGKTM